MWVLTTVKVSTLLGIEPQVSIWKMAQEKYNILVATTGNNNVGSCTDSYI